MTYFSPFTSRSSTEGQLASASARRSSRSSQSRIVLGRSALGRTGSALALMSAGLLVSCGGRGAKPIIFLDQAQGQVSTSNGKSPTATPYNGDQYIVDPHGGGRELDVVISSMYWGRLVDVYDRAPSGDSRLVYPDYVIGEDVVSELSKWEVDSNVVTGEVRLTILAQNEIDADANGVQIKDAFDFLLEEASATVTDIEFRDTEAIGTLTRIARNCAIVVQFDDLIDEETIVNGDTVKVLTGNPPVIPFDARIFADPNFGGLDPVTGEFHSTRMIVDMTVNQTELTENDSLPLNSLGLPLSNSQFLANVAIFIPTLQSPSNGQFRLLTNLDGRRLATVGNEPFETNPTADVVRAMRTGTSSEPNNGFLIDTVAPAVLGGQSIFIPLANITRPINADEPSEPDFGYEFEIDFAYITVGCAVDALAGHIVQVSNTLLLEVLESATQAGGTVTSLLVSAPRDRDPIAPEDIAGNALYRYPWRPEYAGLGVAPCFLNFAPSAGTAPATNVPNAAQVAITFSEAMDPESFGAFDTFRISRNAAQTFYQNVVGSIAFSPDLREARFQPVLPFANTGPYAGDANVLDYFLTIVSDETNGGLRDLAGNLLDSVLPTVSFTVASTPTFRNGGYVFRFSGANLDETGDAIGELRGQVIQLPDQGIIRPRPVSRFARFVDQSQPMVAVMQTPAVPGVQTPLSNLGSRLHHLWRYSDMGLDVSRQDGTFVDLDVEFAYLSPVGGQIVAAFYPEYSVGMAHSRRSPDEFLNQLSFYPDYANSGFASGSSFADTYLQVPDQQPQPMHARELGFVVATTELATADSGTPLLRLPMNKGLDPEDRELFTWRNTSITTRGQLAPNGSTIGPGVPSEQEVQIVGFPACFGSVWGGGGDNGLPTAALPLLIEHRTYPTETLALINFDIVISNGSSKDPSHRAFSTGGYNTSGAAVVKNPDLQTSPTGGFQGLTGPGLPPLGAITAGLDNTVYFGQVDFVVRISRAFSTAIDANAQPDPIYTTVVVEPSSVSQPLGTQVNLAFRGHDTVIATAPPGPGNQILDASFLDVYGEHAPVATNGLTTCTGAPPLLASQPTAFMNTDFVFTAPTAPGWRSSINQLSGIRYVQHRITFLNNTDSGLSPTLSSIGVAFTY